MGVGKEGVGKEGVGKDGGHGAMFPEKNVEQCALDIMEAHFLSTVIRPF